MWFPSGDSRIVARDVSFDDIASMTIDIDKVVYLERIQNAEQNARDVVFYRIAHGETDGKTDDTSRTEDGP